jgi:uncharacterized membrane protein
MDPAGTFVIDGLLIACLAIATLLLYVAPAFGRKSLYFGVEIDPTFAATAPARRVLRGYRRTNLALGIGGMAATVTAAVIEPVSVPVIATASLSLLAVGGIAVFVLAHRRVLTLVLPTEQGELARKAERHWIAGLIYFNPGDPKLWIEKRFGGGITVNFARPMAWVLLGLPLFFAVFILVVVGMLS